jgi:hypothetical protein
MPGKSHGTSKFRLRYWLTLGSADKMSRISKHRLEFLDHLSLKLARATERRQLMQFVWIYESLVKVEGLERFLHNFNQSIGNRLVELSPLPFGRPRWVRPQAPPSQIRLGEGTLARSELLTWANKQAELPIDPVSGPGALLTFQSFSDGSCAVSFVSSHVIGDGSGGMLAVTEAIQNRIRNPGYGVAKSRSLPGALFCDLSQSGRDLPETFRALVKAATLVISQRNVLSSFASSLSATAANPADDPIVNLSKIAIFIDLSLW